ncbi:hypothetical protein CMI37_28245 [Candidatus Pacearchaeota archaeon]|nr:hypothetical protein [Candidatus Pacearchaeota archaeon]|tara:strand:+ start:3102 stop:3410 length:309 start_codon:yes stop_codon:yes gene_type:complete
MGKNYAAGKKAIGFCDRCGFQYLLNTLKAEVVNLELTGFLVCYECWDPDQPQYQVGRWPFSDPQALRNPRPDQALQASRNEFGFDPVSGLSMPIYVNSVTVT